jgi:hypothetical protein
MQFFQIRAWSARHATLKIARQFRLFKREASAYASAPFLKMQERCIAPFAQ